MKSKTTSKIAWTLSGLVSLAMTAGAILKLTAMPPLVQLYFNMGLLPYMKILSIAEITFIALFLPQRTMKLGFCLLTGYLGGAIAVELSHGNPIIAPSIVLTLVWLAAYLRSPSIFSITGNKEPDHTNEPAPTFSI